MRQKVEISDVIIMYIYVIILIDQIIFFSCCGNGLPYYLGRTKTQKPKFKYQNKSMRYIIKTRCCNFL